MKRIFKVDNQTLINFFRIKGRTGNLNEMMLQHFFALDGSVVGLNVIDAIKRNMIVLSFMNSTTSLNQALMSFFLFKTANSDPVRQQELFFSDPSTYDFDSNA